MNRIFLLFVMASFSILNSEAQNWGHEDNYSDNSWRMNDTRQPRSGGAWQSNNGSWDNPYQDPNYYPSHPGHRPYPHQGRSRNVVVVAPPPSYCAPVVVVARPPLFYRSVGHPGHRFKHRNHCGIGRRGWR